MPRDDGDPVGRSVWAGSITFGLVTVPVELYAATRHGRVAFRMLSPQGVPLARQYVCPADDHVVSGDELVRGYPVGKNEFIAVEDEELQRLAPRSSRDIELSRFVPLESLDPVWFENAYFLIPGAEQTKAYRLLAETMESSGRAAIASFVMRGKAHPVAISAEHGILRAAILRFAEELRSPQDVGLPEARDVDAARVKRMAKAISALAADALDAAELADEQSDALLKLARQKRERGQDVVEVPEVPAEEEGGELIDLLALVKQRLHARGDSAPKRAPKASGAALRSRRRTRSARETALEDAPRATLYARARELGIEGRSKMTRAQLLAAVRRAS